MDKVLYHSTIKTMQEAGVSSHYVHGWATGALQNPALEEQRITEAYTAGFEDGSKGRCDGYKEWITQPA